MLINRNLGINLQIRTEMVKIKFQIKPKIYQVIKNKRIKIIKISQITNQISKNVIIQNKFRIVFQKEICLQDQPNPITNP